MTEFLASNWLWIALIVAMLAVHRRVGCGMHGHRQHRSIPHDQAAHHDHRDASTSQPTGK